MIRGLFRELLCSAVACLGLSLSLLFAQATIGQDAQSELERGKNLYREARFGEALARLQSVLVLAEGQSGAEALREEAHLYIGLTFFALDEPEAARDAFRSVLLISPERRLDAEVHAPRLIELFEEARRELAEGRGRDPKAEIPTATTTVTGGPSRLGWAALGAAAGAAGTVVVQSLSETSSSSTTTTTSSSTSTTTSIPPATEVDYRVNGVKMGTFSCSNAIVFTIDVVNRSDEILRVEGFEIEMTSGSPECFTHQPAVDGNVNVELLPDARDQVRRVDLAGDLCSEPGRIPGCDWTSRVLVTSSDGELMDEVRFSTIR